MTLDIRFGRDDRGQKAEFRGALDEHCRKALQEALPKIEGGCRLNLSGITDINSMGIRDWGNFVRDLTDGGSRGDLRFEACPSVFIANAMLVPAMVRKVKVDSFDNTFVCHACGRDTVRRFNRGQDFEYGKPLKLPEVPCGHCQGKTTPECADDEIGLLFL